MNSKEKIEELLEASRDGTITAAQATEVGKFKVKKMEVTPLLWSLYLDYDEAMKVYEDEKNKFEYTGTDYGTDLYGRANIDQVRYKDGTVLTLDLTMGGIAGGGEKQDKENGVMIIRNSFPQLVDIDNLQAVHFGNIDQWLEVRE